MPILSSSELAQIKSDVNEIVQDTSINTTVKYRQFTGGQYARVQDQQFSNPYTDWSGVSAIMGLVTRDDQQRVGSEIEVGDTKFVFMQSSVSGELRSKSDLIVESGVTYSVKKITSDPLEIAYVAYGRSV